MIVKPADIADLRRILNSTAHSIDADGSSEWLKGITKKELLCVAMRGTRKLRVSLAQDHSSVALLVLLSSDSDPIVRAAVARNLATPPPTLRLLSRDTSQDVRQAASLNPGCPKEPPLTPTATATPATSANGPEVGKKEPKPIVPTTAMVKVVLPDPPKPVRLDHEAFEKPPGDPIARWDGDDCSKNDAATDLAEICYDIPKQTIGVASTNAGQTFDAITLRSAEPKITPQPRTSEEVQPKARQKQSPLAGFLLGSVLGPFGFFYLGWRAGVVSFAVYWGWGVSMAIANTQMNLVAFPVLIVVLNALLFGGRLASLVNERNQFADGSDPFSTNEGAGGKVGTAYSEVSWVLLFAAALINAAKEIARGHILYGLTMPFAIGGAAGLVTAAICLLVSAFAVALMNQVAPPKVAAAGR